MLRTSLVPTIIKGGFRINVIPADAQAEVDVRALPDENMDSLKADLARMINDSAVQITSAPNNLRPATPPSGLDTAAFHALERAQTKVFPGALTIPIMQVGATDSSELRAKGVQAYGIEPVQTAHNRTRIHVNDDTVQLARFANF